MVTRPPLALLHVLKLGDERAEIVGRIAGGGDFIDAQGEGVEHGARGGGEGRVRRVGEGGGGKGWAGVERIAKEGMAEVGEHGADLVEEACFEGDFEQGGVGEGLDGAPGEGAASGLGGWVGGWDDTDFGGVVLGDGEVHLLVG